MVSSKLRSSYAAADRWLRDHVVAWWLLLALVPGGTYAAAELLLSDGSSHRALILGVVFGATFATVTVVAQRWRG
ncbi:hypothetical protein [Halostella litorea]|uniref:hypothetical protein n=1 Tax=Halostella litorea TaxID=2528831 RepID=UPI0010923296|nr:hypothetical protein [Halostella litorea]